MQRPFVALAGWKAGFEPGAVVRTDGEVAEAKVFVHADGSITFTCPDRSGPPGQMNPNQEGVCWARGEWDSEAVVALRALAALGASC